MDICSDILGSLCRPTAGRSRRVSSNEQPNWHDGNFDSTHLDPGDVLEMPILEGPGYINHIWFTSHAGGMSELNAFTLRIYWDGEDEPGVEVPMGDFFAVGERPEVVESFPVQVSPTGSLACYWRMPFFKSARITVTNDNPERGYGLYWQVDYVQLEQLPADTMRFYARYRQEYPAQMGRDYLIADIQGKGKYVGTIMSVTMGQDGWFGEGDDFFYIDGEEVPSLQGTGSEDYFNDGWGFRKRTSIWYGQPRWNGWNAGDGGICYRWHILDPVNFENSLRLEIEHKGNYEYSEDAWYLERPDFFSSIAIWYQQGKPKAFGFLPSYPERCVPWKKQLLVRQFKKASFSDGTKLYVTTTGMFGGRPALVWSSAKQGDLLTLPFTIDESGEHVLRLTAYQVGGHESPVFRNKNTGQGHNLFAVEIDGKEILRPDRLPSLEFSDPDIRICALKLEKGQHTIGFRCLSDGANSLGIENLRSLLLPEPARRDIKTFNEAHFYRLGIGRAVYAYRLAYGELPDSLQTLVDTEVMEPRYLRDENGYLLESFVDGDQFVARSTAPDGWQASWKGDDARR